MSDLQGSPSKITKLSDADLLEEALESMEEEGQEEWLSEDVLTDDDYSTSINQSEMEITNQDMTMDVSETNFSQSTTNEPKPQNIEELLNDLDTSKEFNLDAFLIKNPKKNEDKPQPIDKEDDGNDTDELLRVLGDGNAKTKKVLEQKRKRPEAKDMESSDDDDPFTFEKSNLRKTAPGFNAGVKLRTRSKVPSEDGGSDMSSEEDGSDNSFTSNQKSKKQNVAAKSTAKSAVKIHPKNAPKKPAVKEVVAVSRASPRTSSPRAATPQAATPRAATPRAATPRAATLRAAPPRAAPPQAAPPRAAPQSLLKPIAQHKTYPAAQKSQQPKTDMRPAKLQPKKLPEPLYEGLESDEEKANKDEDRMDMSDAENFTDSEDGSLYDALPSSDSDDLEDWFTIDLRTERAGDYLPLLGEKAYKLLSEEKERVSLQLWELRQSLHSLRNGAKRQAEAIRSASRVAQELDDKLAPAQLIHL